MKLFYVSVNRLFVLGLLLFTQVAFAENIMLNKSLPVEQHDVKFIVESSLSASIWDSGESKVLGTDSSLLEYDTKGLSLYTLRGKVNIFDTDVLTIEKYATFEKGVEQKELLKQREYNKKSAVEGVNFSLRAFLLLKHFYFYKYDFLDDLEFQYDYYNFYARARNNIDVVYWWGIDEESQDYVFLPAGHIEEFTTEFNEHRYYLVDLKRFVKHFFIDSLRVGAFSTYWVKESFVGLTMPDGLPKIQDVLLESKGISFEAKHSFRKLNLKFRFNYGLDNYVVVSNGHYDANYYSYDFSADYRYDIYKTSRYTIFAKVNAFLSDKWFDNTRYKLDTDTIYAIALNFGVVF